MKKPKTNKYMGKINLYGGGDVTFILDLQKQINHYTKEEKKSIYDASKSAFKDFLKLN